MPDTTIQPEETTPATDAALRDEPETGLESLASICTMLVVITFIWCFVFQNMVIPSASMEKTLLIGDHVMVDQDSLAPPSHWFPLTHYREVQRGDVIVFWKPVPEPDGTYIGYLVKRCIGIPGDHIRLRDGVVYLNGVAQNEPYAQQPAGDFLGPQGLNAYRDDFPSVHPDPNDINVTPQWGLDLPNHIQNGDLVVPKDSVFAMGDNRAASLDGRYWGFVPRANIVGRPLFVYWSFVTPADQMYKTRLADQAAFVGHVILHFFTDTRWSRTFHVVR